MGALAQTLFSQFTSTYSIVFYFWQARGPAPTSNAGCNFGRLHEIEPGFKRLADRTDGLRYLVVVC